MGDPFQWPDDRTNHPSIHPIPGHVQPHEVEFIACKIADAERAIDRGREGAEGLPFLLALMYSSHIDYEIEYVTREGRPLRQSEDANHGQRRRASEHARMSALPMRSMERNNSSLSAPKGVMFSRYAIAAAVRAPSE